MVAISHSQEDDTTIKGWWRIATNACARLVAEYIDKPEYRVHARLEGEKSLYFTTQNQSYFCVSPGRFITGQVSECAQSGYEAAPFALVSNPKNGRVEFDLNETNFVAID